MLAHVVPTSFFLYARKSSDSEERQILSIDAQLRELREYGRREQFEVRGEFTESRTAKEPGRPIFNEMLYRIEQGQANGILAWHPDRLARNSVDGGRIIYLLDQGVLQSLKFPTFWFDNTPQGKFMMNMAFGQSKYYVDNLSENVKRGIREKLRRGEWPGWAPVGYDNDLKEHKIVVNTENARFIRKLFREYAKATYTYDEICAAAKEWGLKGRRGNKPISRSEIERIFTNPFYYGHFRYRGELYEGAHKPIISKQIFDRVQTVLTDRSRYQYSKRHLFPFNRFMVCAKCGRTVVGQRQKGIHYYRCTSKRDVCAADYVKEELIVEQVQDAIGKVALPKVAHDGMLGEIANERRKANNKKLVSRLSAEIA